MVSPTIRTASRPALLPADPGFILIELRVSHGPPRRWRFIAEQEDGVNDAPIVISLSGRRGSDCNRAGGVASTSTC